MCCAPSSVRLYSLIFLLLLTIHMFRSESSDPGRREGEKLPLTSGVMDRRQGFGFVFQHRYICIMVTSSSRFSYCSETFPLVTTRSIKAMDGIEKILLDDCSFIL